MKATIIGAGNLGGAIARGIARGTFLSPEDITCVDTNPEALERLRETGLPFRLMTDVRKAIPGTDIFILAVKPHVVQSVILQTRDMFDFEKQIFFSAVGGVSFEQLDKMMFGDGFKYPAGKPAPIHFRVMPNIAISIGESMTFIVPQNANPTHIKLAETIFGEMGRTMVITECLLPAATAVGSCGIAYIMRYVRAATTAAIEAGFYPEQAHAIVMQTIKGAIDLMIESDLHPELGIDQVTTPGGCTVKGLISLEKNGFSSAIISAIRDSYER